MKKVLVMTIMLVSVVIVFGGIFLFKYHKNTLIKKKEQENRNKVFTVSAIKANSSTWESKLQVVGSSRTVKGVNITPELSGMITKIDFKPGSTVAKGDLLVQLDIAPELAKLQQLEAEKQIARITYYRDLRQYKIGGISKEKVDQDRANFKSTTALVEEEKAMIAKKTVRAPFSGRVGISLVNPGQYLNPGDAITTLETLKPIYIDFYVPQKMIPQLKVGKMVEIKIDAYPQDKFTGPITTINPLVDESVRNILVEATLRNERGKILPGIFSYVTIKAGKTHTYITLPQMAVTFNPYGSIVYILKPTDKKIEGKQVWEARQQFVTTGNVRGNQVSILKGVSLGDTVVTAGQLKIKNGSLVVINNSIQPPDNPDPYLPIE